MLEGVARGGTCGTEGAGLELLLLLPPSPLPLKALILSAMEREPAWDRRDILNLL